jgi:hypothetical protein
MVWVFHFCIFMGVSLEEYDVFSIILFLVESVVFTMHLYIEWNESLANRNKRMRKWTISSVTVIGILIFCRYSAFYTRYYIGQSFILNLGQSIGLVDEKRTVTDLFTKDSRFYRLFSKAHSSNRIYLLFGEFYMQLVYLALAALTMISLRSTDEVETDESEESDLDNLDAKGPLDSSKNTGFTGIDNFIRSIQNLIKLEEKNLLPEDLIKNSRFVVFFIFLVLQRALTFTVIVFICSGSNNFLDFTYIFIELSFFILLFHNLAGEFKAFGLEAFNEKNIEYFGNGFCKQLLTFDPINQKDLDLENQDILREDEDKYGRITVKDVEQNCLYVNLLLERMQNEVTGLTTIVSFMKMTIVALKSCLAVYQIIMYMGFYHQLNENTKSSMVTNTILNTLILVELLTVKDYRKATKTESSQQVTAEGISYFCTMLQSKLDYYCAFIKQSLWEYTRSKQISRMQNDLSSHFLQVHHEHEEDPKPKVEEVDQVSKERSETIKFNLRTMGSTSSISNHFAKFRLSTVDPKLNESLFLNNVTKAIRIKIEPSEILIREKKEKFDDILTSYKNFKYVEAKFYETFQYNFFQTYDMYTFETPERYFANFSSMDEEYQHEEDEFDLGLNTYEKHVIFVIGIGTPRLLKIFLMHKNKTKFNYCRVLKGLQYLLRRLLLVPVLYIVCIEPNVVNLPLLLVGFYYTFRGQRTIIMDVRLFMPIYSVAFYIMFIWNSLLTSYAAHHSQFRNNPLFRPVPRECSLH